MSFVLVASFLVMIWLPMVLMVIGKVNPDAASSEKRALGTFPTVEWNVNALRVFPSQVDAWLQDHFGMRNHLIHWHNLMAYFWFHVSPSPKVIVGKKGWLFYAGDPEGEDGDPIKDYRGIEPLSLEKLDYLRWMIQDQHEWLQDHGIHYLYALVPSKPELYPQFLPDGLTKVGPNPREQLLAYLEKKGTFSVLDTTPAIKRARTNGILFMKTDSHWNDYGSYVAYAEIMNALTNQFPAVAPYPESAYDFQVEIGPGRDLSEMLDLSSELRDEMLKMRPMQPRRADRKRLSDDSEPDIVTTISDENLPTAMIYRDSFSNRLLPYLAEHFRSAKFEWARKGTIMRNVETVNPDIVLQIMNDRALRVNLKYAGRMRQDLAEKRFVSSTNILMKIDAQTGFNLIQPLCQVELNPDAEGLQIKATGKSPGLEIPLNLDVTQYLPIVQLRIRAPRKTRMALYWDHNGEYNDHYRLRASLQPGLNEIILPLYDMMMKEPLQLYIGKHAGDYVLESIEIRGLLR